MASEADPFGVECARSLTMSVVTTALYILGDRFVFDARYQRQGRTLLCEREQDTLTKNDNASGKLSVVAQRKPPVKYPGS